MQASWFPLLVDWFTINSLRRQVEFFFARPTIIGWVLLLLHYTPYGKFYISLCGHISEERKIDFRSKHLEIITNNTQLLLHIYYHHQQNKNKNNNNGLWRSRLLIRAIPLRSISWWISEWDKKVIRVKSFFCEMRCSWWWCWWWCRRPWPWPFIVKVCARSIMLEI